MGVRAAEPAVGFGFSSAAMGKKGVIVALLAAEPMLGGDEIGAQADINEIGALGDVLVGEQRTVVLNIGTRDHFDAACNHRAVIGELALPRD